MPNVTILNVLLHKKLIGSITRLPDDRMLFAFDKEYISDRNRATLSLSFKDEYGELNTDTRPTARAPTFFANLLPEGHLREYLASRAGVSPTREFFLLWVLGRDLPGAVEIVPADGESWPTEASNDDDEEGVSIQESALRFSLAGVQLKFSAIKSASGGLAIPANGVGGSWIVKLPSTSHAGVPENEFAMMELARSVGIEVPETALVPLSRIKGIPAGTEAVGANAFVIRRFDRLAHDVRVHIEDFAQIFRLYPEKKYREASYTNIAEVLSAETGEAGVEEFIRRFAFNALIGNGDMHLKNWSVIYPDKRKAAIAPAYDFVSTIAYIQGESLALNFAGSKSFADLTYDRFDRFASKAKLSSTLVRDTVKATVERFRAAWADRKALPIAKNVAKAIDAHLKTLPFAM